MKQIPSFNRNVTRMEKKLKINSEVITKLHSDQSGQKIETNYSRERTVDQPNEFESQVDKLLKLKLNNPILNKSDDCNTQQSTDEWGSVQKEKIQNHNEFNQNENFNESNSCFDKNELLDFGQRIINELKSIAATQLKAGLIRKSRSSALRIVDKKDGTIRITVDYKPLNKIIKGDSYPLPSIKDLFNKLVESDTFTRMDIKSAYHQIPVDEESIKFTAFICEFGLYEYLCMPMGIKTAPAWFQRVIEDAFKELINRKLIDVYIDDTFIFTNTQKFGLKFHQDVVMEVINILRQRNLKISLEKFVPAAEEIELLGFIISKNQIKPKPNRAKCLLEKDKPKNVLEFQCWLGIANGYRTFIEGYAQLMKPLYDLMGLKEVPKKFLIEYIPGQENIIADSLSRLPDENEPNLVPEEDYLDNFVAIVEEADESDFENLDDLLENNQIIAEKPSSESEKEYITYETEQKKDPNLVWIMNLIKENGDNKPNINQFEKVEQRLLFKQYDKLRLIEDILYRMYEDENGFHVTKFVLPAQTLIKQIHSSVFNEHLGRNKTTEKIMVRFNRPFLRKEIKKAIKECEICQKVKNTTGTHKGELHFLTRGKPNELITVDIAGPFRKTKNLNKYFLTKTVATILIDEWFCKYGIPNQILTDQGTQFQSKLLDLIYEYLDVKKLKTTPFHPQCDGQSERSVQTVKTMIKSYIDEEQLTWDENLPKYAYAYNSSEHEATKFTPFELMFGRKPKI
ncbi:unnamed protein product [Brachionus calyciflorus]|uniref:Uncharacterized protein n=1 Tax=Brachionus calyciflorus TaxID=104777 RepID=A0A813ZJT1_9BILA|nr:unnamed protein product [Brachionus calyciflorus]